MNIVNFAQIYPAAASVAWATQAFTGFNLDSRKVEQGQIFVATYGYSEQPLDVIQAYVEQALAAGAVGVVTEIKALLTHFPTAIYVENVRQVLGVWQRDFLQAQSAQVLARAVAVTGTNGKTTVSRLIAELLTLLGQPTAVMGTTGNGILPNLTPSTHTTLEGIQLQNAIYRYSQDGAKFVALEASSHGLDQGRLAGTQIEVASFTNLSRDHLDYHGDLQEYAQAKAKLFQFESLKTAIIHQDVDFADMMIAAAQANPSQPQILRYSTQQATDYWVSDVTFSLQGASFTLHSPQGEFQVHSPLLGKFNVENLLAAVVSVEQLGFALSDIVEKIPQLHGAAGRMQTISGQNAGKDALFIVDYAHTPDALEQVLRSLRHHVTGKLWAVFGCGGDRDRGKRPLMTQVALDYADQVILTADNPRTENLEQILQDMVQGIDLTGFDVQQIADRREAIKFAVQHAQAGDIVVIAGKGHENYQEIDGVRHWFDDVVEVQGALQQLSHPTPPTQTA
ncbi:MAG: UDP-N-acetylmuramoyl-L-alanyl-D-glutamate--2,6-diaminopimelate ligase [Acinetobacter sp.]|nr:UDP-N-acetylmuramoyl-L-alanyl-D-glutamate--2,6-diaminopimelate ligase [Acinetobacter sp.]